MSRVLVVFTGGTIGATANDGVIGVDGEKSRVLLDLVRQSPLADGVEFLERSPLSILSENSRPLEWSVIAEEVIQATHEGLGGVVVAHGTDTLPYAASALAFALAGISVPVVLVLSLIHI